VTWLALAAALAAVLAAGYGLGRWRPWYRLGDWVDWQLRFRLNRWSSRPRQAALLVLLLATDPAFAVRSWRHRHDPPPPRSPAIRVPDDPARQTAIATPGAAPCPTSRTPSQTSSP
jgi:hypothetical protein